MTKSAIIERLKKGSDRMKLENKVAIVTGSGRGIGRATAIELAKEGAKVVLSDIDLKECRNVCDEIKKIGSDAIAAKKIC